MLLIRIKTVIRIPGVERSPTGSLLGEALAKIRKKPGRGPRPGVSRRSQPEPDRPTQSPLRSAATTRIPFRRPRFFTTSSLAGTVMLRRGAMQIPSKFLGLLVSLGLRSQDRQAVEHQGRGIVDPHLVGRLALDGGTTAKLGADQAAQDALGQGVAQLVWLRTPRRPGPAGARTCRREPTCPRCRRC